MLPFLNRRHMEEFLRETRLDGAEEPGQIRSFR